MNITTDDLYDQLQQLTELKSRLFVEQERPNITEFEYMALESELDDVDNEIRYMQEMIEEIA